MSTSEYQNNVLKLTISRVRELFATRPDKVHGFDHAERVAAHAAHIASEEGEDVLMATLAGWLHDIGRAIEERPEDFSSYDSSKTHHELSYELLRDWFREDERFSILTDEQKLELLYAVRNHWNDEANEYMSAVILRDADKLDALGDRGLQRSKDFFPDKKKRRTDMRMRYHMAYFLKTTAARSLLDENHLLDPINGYMREELKSGVLSVEL